MDFTKNLPLELLEEIFLYLTNNDLIRCSLVCHRWREIINCDRIWYKQCVLQYVHQKPYLNEEDSFLLYSKKLSEIVTTDCCSYERLSSTCYWRSHFNRYRIVKNNWKNAYYLKRRVKINISLGEKRCYEDGMLADLDRQNAVIYAFVMCGKNVIPFYIRKKYKDAKVDDILIWNGHLIYTQSYYLACFKKCANELRFLYEFEVVKGNRCKYGANDSAADDIRLTTALSDKLFLVQDNNNRCILNFYEFTTGTLLRRRSIHESLSTAKDSCPYISSFKAHSDKLYLSYTIADKKYLISQYNFKLDQWVLTFDSSYPAVELIVSNQILCAKIVEKYSTCTVRVWSLQSKFETKLAETTADIHLPIVLTNDNKLIYCQNEVTVLIRDLQDPSLKVNQIVIPKVNVINNIYTVCDNFLVIATSPQLPGFISNTLHLWDYNSLKDLQSFPISRKKDLDYIFVDDKTIVTTEWGNWEIISFW